MYLDKKIDKYFYILDINYSVAYLDAKKCYNTICITIIQSVYKTSCFSAATADQK